MARLTSPLRSGWPLLLLAACATSPQEHANNSAAWQRSLADARQLANRAQLPLLLAVNMDGESASDRITHENYREVGFVAASQGYAAVIASLFRHSARDYDDLGRRIPCPRLGCVTCGEHIALEGELFAGPLADGERIAPRHAVLDPQGSKQWDLSLTFDLLDITKAVQRSAGKASAAEAIASDWVALARARTHAGRSNLEARLFATQDHDELKAALAILGAYGDVGSLDALRIVAAKLPDAGPSLQAALLDTTRQLQLDAAMATVLREAVQTIDSSARARRNPSAWLQALRELDGPATNTRGFLAACSAVTDYGATGLDFAQVAAVAAQTRAAAAGSAPQADPFTRVLANAQELEAQLAELDTQLQHTRDDAELRARFALASLDLARVRLDAGGRDASWLLADAERSFGMALTQQPARADWWIHRARTAFLQSEFAAQVAHASQALRAARGVSVRELDLAVPLADPTAVEALRWLGDGLLRQFPARCADAKVTAAELSHDVRDSLTALALVATSPFGDDNDWTGFASACGGFGLWREQCAAARMGALRLPAAPGIRGALHQALWAGGASLDVAEVAEAIAAQCQQEGGGAAAQAGARWYAGYACILLAEQHRRAEQASLAIAAYQRARGHFGADSTQYSALCWLGQGFAHVRHHDRAAAAECLLQAIACGSDLTTARDGLGYDALDLVDKIFEWRARGSSPVDPRNLFARIEAVAPATPYWAVAIADSQLREALRADGRIAAGRPTEPGDAHLLTCLALLREARARLVSEPDRVALAQADTIWAERQLARQRDTGVAFALREACELLGQELPTDLASPANQPQLATHLRQLLGEARPRWRDGR